MNTAAQQRHGPPQALDNFRGLAEVLVKNFEANAALETTPHSQVILVLGSSASDNPTLTPWTQELKRKILKKVGGIFKDDYIFLEEICRVFSDDLGHHLWSKDSLFKKRKMREAIERLRIEKISSVACQMLGHADLMVRELISQEYKMLDDAEKGPPPHLTYELLAHLVMHGFVNHIITMNFDEMLDTALENELGSRGFKKIITGHEPLKPGEVRLPRLFKVHGTASDPESLRFTYPEVSMLTLAQAKHLNKLLEGAGKGGSLSLVSFGYSWQDPDLAHWVLANLDKFNTIFVVRRQAGLPEIFDEQSRLGKRKSPFRVLSIDSLCGGTGRALPSSLLWWSLLDEVWRQLEERQAPLIPFSRHLLLGNLPDKHQSLASRVQTEILLHLLKSKGMVNTFGAPDSPRIRAYFLRLGNVNSKITVENFLDELKLIRLMQRSREPEARDTFFSKANSIEGFVESVSTTLVDGAEYKIERPVFMNNVLVSKHENAFEFVKRECWKIFNAPEIEISKEVNIKLHWIFSRPLPILSFSQFANAIRRVINSDWTHLLAIVESKRWLDYPWTKECFQKAKGRNILMILPSLEGLYGWRVGSALRASQEGSSNASLFELEIPWWSHNRHMFLPVQVDGARVKLGDGIFFLREYKSPAIAPVLLKEPRDQAKLLATFMLYAQRSTMQNEGEFKVQLKNLVEQLLVQNGIDKDMEDLVKKSFTVIAKGKGSTEVPKKLLEEWLAIWSAHHGFPGGLRVQLRPNRAGSEVLELGIYGQDDEKLANVVFTPIHDRKGHSILSVRDQNTFAEALRKKRLMTLIHLWLVHRFKADAVHYVTPTEDNQYQTAKMKSHGIFREVNQEVGQIIVADVNHSRIAELLNPDRQALGRLIRKEG